MDSTTTHSIPTHAQVVIIGGGIVGCSVAYHLTRLGWRDVVLLERKRLTCGTTWHAAGLVVQLRPTQNMTRLAQYTAKLYATLEKETGQPTGFRQNGSLSIARTPARMTELTRNAAMGSVFGVEVEVVSPARLKQLWPMMHVDDLVGGIYCATDGQTNPTDTATALARGARMGGARVIEGVKVTGIHTQGGRSVGVTTEQGSIRAEHVVNCGGMWAREIGAWAGVNVPLHAAEHFYLVTEPMAEATPGLPLVRDTDSCAYYKEDAGKLLVGAFEPVSKPWGMDGIPESFEFDTLPEDFDHFEPILRDAMHRLPALQHAGIRLLFNGPESFTPDDRYLLGPAPELGNFWVAAGFNSIGIQSAGGVGKVLADWIVDGHPPMDLWDVDIRRMMPFQRNAAYLRDRVTEGLGLLYAMHWPYRQFESARGARKSILHDRLAQARACFGEAGGWERPNWYAPEGVKPAYEYSYGRQNWFAHSAAEHHAVREAVGLFDQSSFGKILVQGRDAEALLNQVCANDVAVPPGRIVYTQWLNERGGIETDVTVTRLEDDKYLVVTGWDGQVRDLAWLNRSIPEGARAVAVDATSGMAVLGLMGPRSRELLARVTRADLSNAGFPFATSREIEIGYALVRASRITYVGELGWELYMPIEFAPGVYDALLAAGQDLGLRHAGFHAMNSLRMEKAYRHWGHDITSEDSPLEAGLSFAVAWDKPAGFTGRDALLRQKQQGVRKRLVQFKLDDPEPLLFHNEPIWRDGKIAGYISSGMFGHTLGASLGMGYVTDGGGPVSAEYVLAGRYDIQVAGRKYAATASLKPFFDPGNKRVRV